MAARKPLVVIGGAAQELPAPDSIPIPLSWISTSGATAGYVIKYQGGVVTWAPDEDSGSGGGGISEAPVNGKPYARKDADWEEVVIADVIPVAIPVACSDETTALTSGTAKCVFRMPHALALTGVRASLTTAQASGSVLTVDINKNGTSILSTKLTIDNTEKTSTTAATAAVISDASLPDDAEISVDIDQVGASTAAAGLKIYLIGTAPTAVDSACIPIGCSDETTALTAGTNKVVFRMPYAMVLSGVRASLTTAQASGSIFTVDINEGGTSILSTKLTIDNTEKSSATAATPPVISDASLANDAEISIDIDQIGNGTAKGLKVYLLGTPS